MWVQVSLVFLKVQSGMMPCNEMHIVVEFMKRILKISSLASYLLWFSNQVAEGLILEKTTCPLGVVLVVYESCPDALVQVQMRSCSMYSTIWGNFVCVSVGFWLDSIASFIYYF